MLPFLARIAKESGCSASATLDDMREGDVRLEGELLASSRAGTPLARVYSFKSLDKLNHLLPELREVSQSRGIPYLVAVDDSGRARLFLSQSISLESLPYVPRLSGLRAGGSIALRDLRPLESIAIGRNLASRLADEIFAKHGHDRLRLFDNLLALLLVKVYDETENPDNLKLVPNGSTAVARNFRDLLGEALDSYGLNGSSLEVDMDEQTVRSCVEILAPYSLMATIRLGASSELLGTFYQEIVTSTFRGSLGAYFTPQPMCELGAALCDVQRPVQSLFDISCGSGTYLVTTFDRIKRFSKGEVPTVFGVDIQKRMVLTTIINLLFHGVERQHIIHNDGLGVSLSEFEKYGRDAVSQGFSIAVGNPPFAGFVSGVSLPEFGSPRQKQRGAGSRVHKIIPFVVKVTQLLAPGGIASLVVPTSVLNAEADQFVGLRKWLLENVSLVAIVAFSRDALVHTGTGVEAAIVVYRKKGAGVKSAEYVLVTTIANLGYDRRGNPITGSEVPATIEKFENHDYSDPIWVPAKVFPRSERWDPVWISSSVSSPPADSAVRLTELGKVPARRVGRTELPDSILYFEVGDCNPASGKITLRKADKSILNRKGRLRQLVRTGDVLLPNHRDSLMAKSFSETGRSAVVVTQDADGALTTDRFIILEPKIDPTLFREILNSRLVRDQLVRFARGSASFDIREKVLSNVWVPRAWMNESFRREIIELSNRKKNLESEKIEVEGILKSRFEMALR